MCAVYLDKKRRMSDIGPIHGLGALIIFLGLLFINTLFLLISILFLFIENKREKRIIPAFSAKGLLLSTLILEIILVALILFIEFSNNLSLLEYIDLISPIFAFTAILAMIIINIRYSKQHRN